MDNYKLYFLADKNDPSNIRYIGQTRNTLEYRLSQHKRESKNTYKNNWIKSIGKNNLIICLIEENILSSDDINIKERKLIKEYKELGYKLTNTTDGGEGWKDMKFTDKHKYNISLNHSDTSGEKNPMYGKKHAKETLIKMSDAKKDNIGNKNNFYNKTHSEKTKQIISEKTKGKLSGSNNYFYGKTPFIEKPIYMTDNIFNVVIRFQNKKELCNYFSMKQNNTKIYKYIDKFKFYRGYYFFREETFLNL